MSCLFNMVPIANREYSSRFAGCLELSIHISIRIGLGKSGHTQCILFITIGHREERRGQIASLFLQAGVYEGL